MVWYARDWSLVAFLAPFAPVSRPFSVHPVYLCDDYMPQFLPASWPIALCALAALPVFAQPKAAATATTVSATIPYHSAFAGYQPFSDEKLHPWKESNSTVKAVGGWRAYAKEAAEPVATKPQTLPAEVVPAVAPTLELPTAIPKPASPHAAHGKH